MKTGYGLEEKIRIYRAGKPYTPEVLRSMNEEILCDWLYGNFRISGMDVPVESIKAILRGEIVPEVSLAVYDGILNGRKLFSEMEECIGMRYSLTGKLFVKFCGIMFPGASSYRQNNPIVYEWSYNPPHYRDVPEMTDNLFKRLSTVHNTASTQEKAASAHLSVAGIYPFGEFSVTAANVACAYILLQDGLPPVRLRASDREYNGIMAEYFRTEDASRFDDMFLRSLANRLDSLIQLSHTEE